MYQGSLGCVSWRAGLGFLCFHSIDLKAKLLRCSLPQKGGFNVKIIMSIVHLELGLYCLLHCRCCLPMPMIPALLLHLKTKLATATTTTITTTMITDLATDAATMMKMKMKMKMVLGCYLTYSKILANCLLLVPTSFILHTLLTRVIIMTTKTIVRVL